VVVGATELFLSVALFYCCWQAYGALRTVPWVVAKDASLPLPKRSKTRITREMDRTKNVSSHENSPSHFLGVFYEGSIDGRRYQTLRELGEEEYRRYVHDVATVLEFFFDYEQYGLVRSAYGEYLLLLAKQAEVLADHVHLNEVLRSKIVLGINRRLRSFLTEFRLFLDHAEAKLKRRYGHQSEQVRAFKAATSRHFDNSFAYRFVYGLRNYAIHEDLPINAISLSGGEGEFDPEDPASHNRLFVGVSRDALLTSSRGWRAEVKPGLEKLPPNFELEPLIKEAMLCLEKIHVELVCTKLAGEKQAAERVIALASTVPRPSIPCVLRFNGPEKEIINAYTLYMERDEDTQGTGSDRLAVHVGWVPVQEAQTILDLPAPEKLSRYENLFLDINNTTPEGEPVYMPS
jgi:hypothetical protein